jgi:hypothetical protein
MSEAEVRRRLLAEDLPFSEGLEALGARLDAGALAYIGHWVTPSCEPIRFDTRFFAAAAPPESEVTINDGEMDEALWLSPTRALERNREGTLPLVFPTVKTLEDLEPFRSPEEALEQLGSRPVRRHLPRVVRKGGEIGFAIDS